MARCYICEEIGINTVADNPEPLVVHDAKFNVCKGCYNLHHAALQRGLRTMFDRLFPANFRNIKARATHKPRVKPDTSTVVATKLTIFPADE